MASGIYNAGIKQVVDRTIDFVGGSIKVALIKAGAGFAFDKTHTSLATALGAAECAATAYARKTLAGKSIAAVSAAVPFALKATNPTWAGLGGAANDTLDGAVVFFDTGTGDANCVPLAWLDPTNLVTNGSDVQLQFDATNGIIYLTN